MKKRILFICGTLNQTSQMHQISRHLGRYDCHFTPYYVDGVMEKLRRKGYLDFTVAGKKIVSQTIQYIRSHGLRMDDRGQSGPYDLIFTCSDLFVQNNIADQKVVLVQEGMTDPENLMYTLVRRFKLPRYLASTSTTGLSNQYGYFCVASEGYRHHFLRKGVLPEKVRVTGIPNFDNCRRYLDNDFPYKGFALVATSDMRETLKWENRKRFIKSCLEIAGDKTLIFKLHPNENVKRATTEIHRWAPNALVYSSGDIKHMIANCDLLITRYSSVVYVGLALGKNVYSDFNVEDLREMTPIQNDGISARLIAEVGRRYVEDLPIPASYGELQALSTPLAFEDETNRAPIS